MAFLELVLTAKQMGSEFGSPPRRKYTQHQPSEDKDDRPPHMRFKSPRVNMEKHRHASSKGLCDKSAAGLVDPFEDFYAGRYEPTVAEDEEFRMALGGLSKQKRLGVFRDVSPGINPPVQYTGY